MKHLFNLTTSEVEAFGDDFNPRKWDRILGDPQPSPGWSLDYMTREGWRGVYTNDETIHSRAELLAKVKENYAAGRKEWVKAPEEVAYEMLCAVPPVMQRGSCFATGEPATSDARGRNVYLCFRGFDFDRPTCEAQYLTISDFVALLTSRE